MSRKLKGFSDFYKAVSGDIFAFCRALRFEPTWQQEQLLLEIRNKTRRVAVKSGQGPGKTTASVVVGLYQAFQDVDSLVVVTAPTMRQCRDVWIVEARRLLTNALPELAHFFNVTKTKIEIMGRPDWGVKLVTATKEENAQGYHHKKMSVIAEEASGIPREIITQFKGTLSNPNSLFLQIGNPNTRDCGFFDCFHSQRHNWACHTWDAEETPESEWFSHERNRLIEEEFGRNSDVYRVRVLGQFPHVDPNCVISSEDLEKVTGLNMEKILLAARGERSDDNGGGVAKQFGMDFARYGSDESTIFRRKGLAILEHKFFSHTDPSEVCDEAFRMQSEAKWKDDETAFVADAGGMGQGIMSRFYERNKTVFEFHNNGRPADSQYDNKITEAWFHLARIVRAARCALPKDNRLAQQLAGRRYYTNKKGKLILETKDDYMKRGFDSPDRADGIVMSFYDEIRAITQMATRAGGGGNLGVQIRRAG